MADCLNSSGNVTIIVSSSDEDENENVEELFGEFVSKVERFVEQNNVVLFLKLKFTEARSEFVSSAKFKNALKWRTRGMNKSNGYIYTGDICKLLLSDSKVDICKVELDVDEKANDVQFAGNGQVVEGDVNRAIETIVDDGPDDNTSDKKEKHPQAAVPSTSRTSFVKRPSSRIVNGRINEKKRPNEIANTSKQMITPRKRKRLVKRLELKLQNLAEKIKILSQAELSLDEMEMNDSTYIQECRLKDNFNRIWDKICRVQGKPPNTGRVTEKEVKCPTTGIVVIDQAIKKFLKNMKGRFPDKFDISNVVQEANKKYGLKLSGQVLSEISDEVFMCIGNTLQKRRKRDFNFNFGCHLTDDYNASNDPAINDSILRKKLEENKKINKKNLDEVFSKFTCYGRMNAHDGSGNSSSSDVEEERPEKSVRVTMKKRFSCISVTHSTDSSENECNEFGLREDINDNTNKIRSEEGSDANEIDLEAYAIKPRQLSGKKEDTKSETKCGKENNTLLQSSDRNLRENSAIVRLPTGTSVLSEGNEICVEHISIEDVDCASQPPNPEILEQAASSKKENTSPVLVKDQPIVIVRERTKNGAVSTNQQLDDSSMKSDSNMVTASNEDLTIKPVETSSNSNSLCHVMSSVNDSSLQETSSMTSYSEPVETTPESRETNTSPGHEIPSMDDSSLQVTKSTPFSLKSGVNVITVSEEELKTKPEETSPGSQETSTSPSCEISSIDNSSLQETKSSPSRMKSDSDVITVTGKDLATGLVETSSESQETNTLPSRVISSTEDSSVQETRSSLDDFDDKTQDVIGKVTGSSFHSDVDNREVIAGKSPKENSSHDDAPKSSLSRKRKGVNLTLSPLTVNIKPISTKGQRILSLSPKKRKAENGSLDFDRPLKSFRKATLEILGNQPSSSCNVLEAKDNKSNLDDNNRLPKGEKDELSVSLTSSSPEKIINSGQPGIEAKSSIRLPSSLNRTGRNSPIKKQKTSERTVISIVLSDDDDSDCEILK